MSRYEEKLHTGPISSTAPSKWNPAALLRRHPVLMLVIVFALARLLISYFYDHPNMHVPVIIVLGGGVASNGDVPSWTLERVNKAAALYKSADPANKPLILTLSRGTPYKPNPVDANGFPVWESTAAAKKLMALGVPQDRIFEEQVSLDTVGNAYFTRVIHIDPGMFRKMILITNDWHMDRAKVIFDATFALCPTQSSISLCALSRWAPSWLAYILGTHQSYYSIEYVPVASGISDVNTLTARREKEAKALQEFRASPVNQWKSLADMHAVIFNAHKAYSSSRLTRPADTLSKEVLSTY